MTAARRGPGALWRDARAALASLKGFERAAAAVAATSLAVMLLEGASVTMLVPFLSSFTAESARRLELIVAALGVLVLARAGAAWLNGVLAARLQLRVLLSLRESLAEAFYRSRYAELSALGGGRLVNVFSMQTERVVAAIGALAALVGGGLLLLLYAAATVILSWRLSLAAAAFGALAAVLTAVAGRRIRAHSGPMVRAEEDSSRLALDDAAGLHVIQAFDVGPERLALHREVNRTLYREAMGLHRWRSAIGPATQALYAVALLGGLLVALAFWRDQLLAHLPVVIAFVFVVHRLQGQIGAVSEATAALAEQEGAALNVFALLDRPAAPDGRQPLADGVSKIEVQALHFAYPGGGPVLQGLDLELMRGEVLAVVGESGSGKSTLAQLLVRLREPGAGRILVDGAPLDQLARSSLARGLGAVFEDAFVFDETLGWNVTLGRDLSARAVADAVTSAGLDEVLRRTARGLETPAGPRGRSLSAGERQRLALARAIVAAPQLLVLDEATNAVDAPTERGIVENLRSRRPDGITLLVAHRLSTVLAADRVAVLEGGRIVATGMHAELLESCAAYRRLVETQLVERPASEALP